MKRIVSLVLAFGMTLSAQAMAASIYVYVNEKGDSVITDHKRSDLKGYRLQKKYQADDHFGDPNRPKKNSSFYRTRASSFDVLIAKKAKRLGLEPALLKAIIHIESAFNPKAISPKGATGLMQLMPATAKRYGVNDRRNPSQSLEGGGRYMRDLLMLFDYDIELALAAYNAGEGAVKRYNGIPPYKETENYVRKVIQMRDLYRKEVIGAPS